MKIIDFDRKGNVVRFYLGEYDEKWGWTRPDYKDYTGKTPDWLRPVDTYYGDDWDDYPYEHNAGRVYDEFIKGYCDVTFDFDDLVLEPASGESNSGWCKNDMIDRLVPCIIAVPKQLHKDSWDDSFSHWVGVDGIQKYYFGDEMEASNGCE